MLHQRMFESGTYKSLLERITLYEAPEASMARTQRDEFLAEKEKSPKQRREDQDHPHPPPDSDLSKRRRRDTSTSGSSQPPAPQSSAWKKSDTQDAPSSSSKQQSSPHAEQPRPEWLKPILDDERPATPEPAWVIPLSYIPNAINNWANALATTYQALTENSLLEKTGDQKMGNTKLTQADLEGQPYEVVKAFYPNVVQLQFQMEKCHKMLTDQINWANPESDQDRIDISKPLPLSGPLGWDAKGFEYKHDYTIIESPRAVVFLVGNNEQKIMRFNKIYKFSDGARNLYMPLNGDSRPEGSSETWNALLVVTYEMLTTGYFREPNEYIISAFRLTDDLLALDSKVRFDFSDRRLELTATFSIPTYSDCLSTTIFPSNEENRDYKRTLHLLILSFLKAIQGFRGYTLHPKSWELKFEKRSLSKAFVRILPVDSCFHEVGVQPLPFSHCSRK
ncbi:hypothetical protein Tco_1274814 [Tanacetum coccineum]